MRAAVFLRISQDRLGEGLGVERQRQDCEQLIAQRGWTHELTFAENDTSAAGRKPRPQFQAMLSAVQEGRCDVIVAWALDRLARTARDRLKLTEACQRHGVIIALVRGTDMDPTTPAGRLLIGLLGEVAQHEIDAKSDRQTRAQRQAAEQGRRSGGRRPFGYDRTGMVLDKVEAKALREGYLWTQQGVPLSEIARRWNARGLTTGQNERATRRPSPWRRDAVRRVLLNPRNAGFRRYRDEIMAQRAVWPAVVDEGTWADVVDILRHPERRSGTPGAQRLLTGVAECGVCHQLVHGGGASHGKAIYRCRSNRHINRLAAPVDEYVTLALLEVLGQRAEAFDYVVDRAKPDLEALRKEADRLRRRLREIADEFTNDPDVSPAQVRVMTRGVNAQLAEVEAQMVDTSRLDLIGPFLDLPDDARAKKLEAAGVHTQRALIAALIRVELFPVGKGTRIFRPETVRLSPR